jgi:hypothetical protein
MEVSFDSIKGFNLGAWVQICSLTFWSPSMPHVRRARAFEIEIWPAPGFEDTELGVFMEPEAGHGETEVHAVLFRASAPMALARISQNGFGYRFADQSAPAAIYFYKSLVLRPRSGNCRSPVVNWGCDHRIAGIPKIC